MITAAQLQPFCSEDETRYQLRSPYIRNGNTYATDGRVAIRAFGCVEGVEVQEKYPDAAAVIDPLPNAGPWLAIELPDNAGEDIPCPDCHGDDDDRECKACNGRAEVTGEYRYNGRRYDLTGECPVCGGSGCCETCDGTGTIHDRTPVKIGRNYYSAHYLRRLLALPGVALCAGEEMEPARIRWDGGDGGIMPMNRDQYAEWARAHGRAAP